MGLRKECSASDIEEHLSELDCVNVNSSNLAGVAGELQSAKLPS
jgi:hypothetical protein